MPEQNNPSQAGSPFEIVMPPKLQKRNKGLIVGILITVFLILSILAGVFLVRQRQNIQEKAVTIPEVSQFRFISWGDAQDYTDADQEAANQATSLSPAFTIFNGDLQSDGSTTSGIKERTDAFGSLFAKTFYVRGNHDNSISGSAGVWENYFKSAGRATPSGITNYIAIDSNSTYLTYSFDYGNSRFIGVDVPGDADLLTNSQATFIDGRLTNAESIGLTHAFIFFHGPEYCIVSTSCDCQRANDGNCTPSRIVDLINKHPIVSATFHGHEHILGWVHMDSSRVAALTHSYEEFITSPMGSDSYNDSIINGRVNYYYPNMEGSQGFAAIDVNGSSFTFSIYKVGTTAAVWSKTFTKSEVVPTPTATATANATATATSTATATATPTSTARATATPSPAGGAASTPRPTANLSNDPYNCGTVGNVCYLNEDCINGVCTPVSRATLAPVVQTTPRAVPVTGIDWPTTAGISVGMVAIILSILLVL